MREWEILKGIAKRMAALHLVDIAEEFGDEKEVGVWKTIEGFCRFIGNDVDGGVKEEWGIGDVKEWFREVEEVKEVVEKCCRGRMPVVFCHNDVHPTNLYLTDVTRKIQLLDFEYGDFNYRSFDSKSFPFSAQLFVRNPRSCLHRSCYFLKRGSA